MKKITIEAATILYAGDDDTAGFGQRLRPQQWDYDRDSNGNDNTLTTTTTMTTTTTTTNKAATRRDAHNNDCRAGAGTQTMTPRTICQRSRQDAEYGDNDKVSQCHYYGWNCEQTFGPVGSGGVWRWGNRNSPANLAGRQWPRRRRKSVGTIGAGRHGYGGGYTVADGRFIGS